VVAVRYMFIIISIVLLWDDSVAFFVLLFDAGYYWIDSKGEICPVCRWANDSVHYSILYSHICADCEHHFPWIHSEPVEGRAGIGQAICSLVIKNYTIVYVKVSATVTTPQPFYGPFSGTTRVSWCQKRTGWSGSTGAQPDGRCVCLC